LGRLLRIKWPWLVRNKKGKAFGSQEVHQISGEALSREKGVCKAKRAVLTFGFIFGDDESGMKEFLCF